MTSRALLLALALPALSLGAESWPDLVKPAAATGGGAKDAAVVVGIDRYAFVARIPGATENAKAWYNWLRKTRKVPFTAVKLLGDKASREDILAAAAEAAKAVKPGGTLWFVFIGHGAPGGTRVDVDGLILGADVQQKLGSLAARGVGVQSELLPALRGQQGHTVLVVDACFSGLSADGESLVPGAQFTTAVTLGATAAVTVLTAGKSDQRAGPLPGAARPAFSYLVLGALRGWGDEDGDGQVTAAEALAYAGDALVTLVTGRKQTPELTGSGGVALATGARESAPDLDAFAMAGIGNGTTNRPGLGFGDLGRLAEEEEALRVQQAELARQREAIRAKRLNEHRVQAAADWKQVEAIAGRARGAGCKAVKRFRAHYDAHELGNPKRDEAAALEGRTCGGGTGKGGVEWVRVPGGSFRMGSTENDDEQPVHAVRVKTFELAKSEVTNAQYQACVAAGSCEAPHWDDGSCYVYNGSKWEKGRLPASFREPNKPVVCVDWSQARAFSKWAGGRLPTEAEWEYAARSGGKDQKYPWGNAKASCSRAVMDDGGNGCGRKTTWAVCAKQSGNSAQGVCDLAGNVWEWVEDVYADSYKDAPTDGSARTSGGSYRVRRGGSWRNAAGSLRAAHRHGNAASARGGLIGFRPARSSH